MRLWPIALLGAAATALFAFAPKKAKAKEGPFDDSVEGRYQAAMDPGNTDLASLSEDADWLEEQGRPDLAANVRSKIGSIQAARAAEGAGLAKDKATWEKSMGGPPSPATVQQMYDAAMAPSLTDIGQLTMAANFLKIFGTPEQAGAVQAKIDSIKAGTYMPGPSVTPDKVVVKPPGGGVMPEPDDDDDEDAPSLPPVPPPPSAIPIPVPSPAPVPLPVPAPVPVPAPPPAPVPVPPVPPIADEETKPEADPNGTILLARLLIDREGAKGWKTAYQPQVKIWQQKVGLSADGKFGPKAGEKMADEVGVLPLVRYWSHWNKAEGLQQYRDALRAKAATFAMDPEKKSHAAALRASADREEAQGFPKSSQVPVISPSSLQAVQQAIEEAK